MIRKVIPGDPLRIAAATYNKFVDAAEYVAGLNSSGPALKILRHLPMHVITIENTTTTEVDQWGILGIGDPIFNRSDNQIHLEQGIVGFTGVSPDASTHAKKFAVALEPIRATSGLQSVAIGKAAVAGIVPIKIDVTDEDHGYAVVVTDDMAALASAAGGPAEILWKESGTGEKWALVRFGITSANSFQVWQATGDAAGGSITGKRVGDDLVVYGEEETFTVET